MEKALIIQNRHFALDNKPAYTELITKPIISSTSPTKALME
ncbi:MAG: hypothetical protein WC581_01660 [Thermodesulfovibrionales bacterium]